MDPEILSILINFDMFSRLGPNLSVHLNRDNIFIVTSKEWASIKGIQTIANIYKQHTTQKLINDLHDFFQKINNVLNKNIHDTKLVNIICREFKLACNGLPNVMHGGLNGLIETYKNDPLILQLKNAISHIQDSINNIKKITNKLLITNNTCPESNFTDNDWEDIMSVVPSLQSEYVGIYKYYINYSSILTLNIFDKYNWWDEIINVNGNKIILGALPIMSNVGRNDLESLKGMGVGAVLSVVEIFENSADGYLYKPIKPIEWKKENFKHYQIPSSDFCTMHLETVEKGVEFINWNIKNDRTIYVHCKSGKSRSFLIVVCYLVKYLGYKSHEAIKYVKSKRIQSGFGKNSMKMEVLERYEKMLS
jgi:protein-tyrosine phosphatase